MILNCSCGELLEISDDLIPEKGTFFECKSCHRSNFAFLTERELSDGSRECLSCGFVLEAKYLDLALEGECVKCKANFKKIHSRAKARAESELETSGSSEGGMVSSYCSNCGEKNSQNDKFCSSCGQKIEVKPARKPDPDLDELVRPKLKAPLNIGEEVKKTSILGTYRYDLNRNRKIDEGSVFISEHREGIKFSTAENFKLKTFEIHFSQIISFKIIKKDDLKDFVEKKNSVAFSAIAGGLALGPLGAILAAGFTLAEGSQDHVLVINFWSFYSNDPQSMILLFDRGGSHLLTVEKRLDKISHLAKAQGYYL